MRLYCLLWRCWESISRWRIIPRREFSWCFYSADAAQWLSAPQASAHGASAASALLRPGYSVSMWQKHNLKSESFNTNLWTLFASDAPPCLSPPFASRWQRCSQPYFVQRLFRQCDSPWLVVCAWCGFCATASATSLHPHVSHKGVKTNRGRVELRVGLLWVTPAQVGLIFFFSSVGAAKQKCCSFFFCCFSLPNIMNENVFLWLQPDQQQQQNNEKYEAKLTAFQSQMFSTRFECSVPVRARPTLTN